MSKITKTSFEPSKIISSYSAFTTLAMDQDSLKDVKRKINLSVIGHANCNVMKNGKLVTRTGIDEETEKYLAKAHHSVGCGFVIEVAWDITEDGSFVNFRVI